MNESVCAVPASGRMRKIQTLDVGDKAGIEERQKKKRLCEKDIVEYSLSEANITYSSLILKPMALFAASFALASLSLKDTRSLS